MSNPGKPRNLRVRTEEITTAAAIAARLPAPAGLRPGVSKVLHAAIGRGLAALAVEAGLPPPEAPAA